MAPIAIILTAHAPAIDLRARPLFRDFQRHQARNPSRCHRTMVSGRTRVIAPAILGKSWYSQTNKARSLPDNFGLFGAFRRRTFS